MINKRDTSKTALIVWGVIALDAKVRSVVGIAIKCGDEKVQLNIDFDVNQLKPNQCYLKNCILEVQSCWQEKNTFYSNVMLKIDGKCIYRRFNFDENRFWFEESSTHEKRTIISKFEELIKESLGRVKQHIVFCDAKL